MADLFRKEALDKLSNPEELNKTLTITSPLSWLALLGVSLILLVTLVWSIVGRIPETVTINGKIASITGSANAVYTDDGGVVQQIYVSEGQELKLGMPVVRLSVNGENRDVLSDLAGIVTKLKVQIGSEVSSGKPLLYLSPVVSGHARQVAVCYASSSVSADDAGKLETNMDAIISMPSADSQSYGHMSGSVISIDRYTTSTDSIAEIFGDQQVANDILKNGAVKSVTVALNEAAAPAPDAKNPYAWSNSKGGRIDVKNGDSITVRVVTRQVRPIEKLFRKIRELMGDD